MESMMIEVIRQSMGNIEECSQRVTTYTPPERYFPSVVNVAGNVGAINGACACLSLKLDNGGIEQKQEIARFLKALLERFEELLAKMSVAPEMEPYFKITGLESLLAALEASTVG